MMHFVVMQAQWLVDPLRHFISAGSLAVTNSDMV